MYCRKHLKRERVHKGADCLPPSPEQNKKQRVFGLCPRHAQGTFSKLILEEGTFFPLFFYNLGNIKYEWQNYLICFSTFSSRFFLYSSALISAVSHKAIRLFFLLNWCTSFCELRNSPSSIYRGSFLSFRPWPCSSSSSKSARCVVRLPDGIPLRLGLPLPASPTQRLLQDSQNKTSSV